MAFTSAPVSWSRAGDSVFNAAVLIGPSGEVLLHHRK